VRVTDDADRRSLRQSLKCQRLTGLLLWRVIGDARRLDGGQGYARLGRIMPLISGFTDRISALREFGGGGQFEGPHPVQLPGAVLPHHLDVEVRGHFGHEQLGPHRAAPHLCGVLRLFEDEAALHLGQGGLLRISECGGVAHVGEGEGPDDFGAEGEERAGEGHGDVVVGDAVPDEEHGDSKQGGPSEEGYRPPPAGQADSAVLGVDDGAPYGVRARGDGDSCGAGAEEVEQAPRRPDEGTEGQEGGELDEGRRLLSGGGVHLASSFRARRFWSEMKSMRAPS
jgi:hypothetical protein